TVIRIPCLEDMAKAGVEGAAEALEADLETPAIAAPATAAPEASGADTAEADAAPAPDHEPAIAEIPEAAPGTRPLRIVAAGGWAPYLDEDQAKGGMLAEMLSAALSRAAPDAEIRIDFINDRGALLRPLIADGAYDVSLAWIRPDCAAPGALGEESAFRCAGLAWSDPLFELIIGFYTRADTPAPAGDSDLSGLAVCRPAGSSDALLEAHGLVGPKIRLVAAPEAGACFEMLLAGEVDAVAAPASSADEAIGALGAADRIAEQPQLATAATLHAVTSADNPLKDAQIGRINEGLRMIRKDGGWFEIVQRHLAAHAARLGAG
ncbi:MAG: transporter substrate-binding domain-containing protein, partial [Paracoccaceae bacterium]